MTEIGSVGRSVERSPPPPRPRLDATRRTRHGGGDTQDLRRSQSGSNRAEQVEYVARKIELAVDLSVPLAAACKEEFLLALLPLPNLGRSSFPFPVLIL